MSFREEKYKDICCCVGHSHDIIRFIAPLRDITRSLYLQRKLRRTLASFPTGLVSTMNNKLPPSDDRGDDQLAPWLPIPSRAISVVEHPCIVKNIDKGISSLGGPVKLSKVSRKAPKYRDG